MSVATRTPPDSSRVMAAEIHLSATKQRHRNRSGLQIGTAVRGVKRTCAGPLSCPLLKARVTGRSRSASCRGSWTSAPACVRRSCRTSRSVHPTVRRPTPGQSLQALKFRSCMSGQLRDWTKLVTRTNVLNAFIIVSSCSKNHFHVLPQTLSYMLQTLLMGQYSVLPNNLSSPQVHLVMHQLNQCYTQLAWQQNNVQR